MAGEYIVFKQTPEGMWAQLGDGALVAANADAAIEAARTSPGTFVAVLVRAFRPRTHYAPPRAASTKAKEATTDVRD